MSKAKIFLIEEDGKNVREMVEAPYEEEEVLQRLLVLKPELLPGDQIDPENPRWPSQLNNPFANSADSKAVSSANPYAALSVFNSGSSSGCLSRRRKSLSVALSCWTFPRSYCEKT
jgi:hypothetical protein